MGKGENTFSLQGRSQDICNVEANAIGVGLVPKAQAGGRAREVGRAPPSRKGGSGDLSRENFENLVRFGGIW